MDDSSPCSTSASETESTEAICCSSISASLGDHNTEGKLSTVSDGNRTNPIDDVKGFPSEGYYIEEEEDDEDEDDLSEEALLSQMGYTKSEPKRSNKEGEEEEEISVDSFLAQRGYLKNEPPKHEPVPTPTAYLNLVSAFKGSREKDGKPLKECRVSWSPEVYDPPCTSDDHFTPSKNERHRSEHKAKGIAGKNRQKSGGKGVAIEGGGKGGKGGKAPGKIKDKKAKKHVSKASKYTALGEN